MGLLDKLTTNGSTYSNLNGGPTPNNLSNLKQSQLHNEYSINGDPKLNLPNTLPSELDASNGLTPISALKAANVTSVNDTFSKGTYKNYSPEGKSF